MLTKFLLGMDCSLMIVIVLLNFVGAKHCKIGRGIEPFNSTLLLPMNQTLVRLEKGERKQYHFEINAPTTIKITFSSCTNYITSKLYYNQSIQIAKAASSLTIQCAPVGRYDVELEATRPCTFDVKAIFHHPHDDWPLLELIESSKLKYQNRIKKRELVVKWNKSKLDIHAVHYCLAINTERNQQSLCEAITHSIKPNQMSKQLCLLSSLEHLYHKKFGNAMKLDPDPQLVSVICVGRRNRLTVKGLAPNKRYFVDLFGVHTQLENLTFLLNSSFLWFNRNQPIVLKSNLLTTFQLPPSGRPIVLVHKIPMDETCQQIKLFTMPCGRNVRLKIISKLDQNSTVMELRKSSTVLLHSRPRDKFLLKFSITEKYNSRSSRKIKVFLSCSVSSTQSPLPQLPQNVTLEQNMDETDCTISSISWNPSPDHRPENWYCIYLIEINQRSHLFDDLFLSNLCVGTSSPYNHPHLYQKECMQIPVSSTENENYSRRIHHTLTQLDPKRYYVVYVMLRLNNISLPYDKLLINTKSRCTFGLNNSYKTQRKHDDDGSIIPNNVL